VLGPDAYTGGAARRADGRTRRADRRMGCCGNDLGGPTQAPTSGRQTPLDVRNPTDRMRAETAAGAMMVGTASHALSQEQPA
jgi:hypothetical protein